MYEIVITGTSNCTYYRKVQDHSLPYLILHNREFRSFGNRKNNLKSATVTLQGNDVRIYLCLHCITVNNNNKTFFPYFFHVHLNILDKVVSSLYANFGTIFIQGIKAFGMFHNAKNVYFFLIDINNNINRS
jgi:hypothetical protein